MTLIFLGTVIYVYFGQKDPQLLESLKTSGRIDLLLPTFVKHINTGYGTMGLLLAAVFAASMSTIEGGVNSIAAIISLDLLPNVKFVRIRRMCMIFGIIIIPVSILLQHSGVRILDFVMESSGVVIGVQFGLLLLGWLDRRANTVGALAALILGLSSTTIVNYFVSELTFLWYSAVTTLTTLIAGVVISRFFPPPTADAARLTIFARR